MTKSLVPQSKLGTPYQSPSWRYLALYYPERFGLGWLTSKRIVDAAHLKRSINKGCRPSTVYSLPLYFQSIIGELAPHLQEVLLKTWNKHYFDQHPRKLSFSSNTSNSVPISWNIRNVEEYLNDDFLKRMVFHCFNYRFDHYIDEAIKFHKDPSNSMNVKWFNYCFFGKLTDKELAHNWNKSLGFVKALRLMFYDYSHWPADRIAQFSMMRQLVTNQEIDDQDYHNFRRIYDLGRLGLKSAIGLDKLNPEEMRQIDNYLTASTVDNMLNLRYTITNGREAHNFGRIMDAHGEKKMKKEEISQRAELLKLTSLKLAREMGVNEETKLFGEDEILLREMREMGKVNFHPKFPSFVEVKAEDAKITVETDS
jgi:hypothetical protein